MKKFVYICIAGVEYIVYKKVLKWVPIVYGIDRIAKNLFCYIENFAYICIAENTI